MLSQCDIEVVNLVEMVFGGIGGENSCPSRNGGRRRTTAARFKVHMREGPG